MKKAIILSMIIILVFALILVAIPAQSNYSKILPNYTHSHTKAICTEQNLCQDYEIFCDNSEIKRMSPITGAVVQFSDDWQDPRPQEIRNAFC